MAEVMTEKPHNEGTKKADHKAINFHNSKCKTKEDGDERNTNQQLSFARGGQNAR